jgi:branched-chain amino acid transport system substrate-binding protein
VNIALPLRTGLLALCTAGFTFTQVAFAIDPIKIGVIVSPSAEMDQHMRDGLDVALKVINEPGGALGRPFELVFQDIRGAPDQAGAAVDKLVRQDKAAAIIGGQQAASALAAVEAAHRHKIPYVANARSQAIGDKLYPEIFTIGLSSAQMASAIADNLKALGAKRVVAFTPNTDAGIELANQLAQQLNTSESGIQYAFETLDPAAGDFSAALQPHKGNPPDVVVQMLQPPAAYALLKQLRQHGIAPSAKTWLYDGAGLIEDPGFWQNVNEPGMLAFAQYHPKMTLPDLGRKIADAYKAKTGKEPTGAVLQAADSVLMIAEAIKTGGSSEPEAVTKALETLKWTGTRGKITFSAEKDDNKYHQWLDVPFVTFQITAVKQPIGETNLVQTPGQPLNVSAVQKPQ